MIRRHWAGTRLIREAVLGVLKDRARDGEVSVSLREIAVELDISVNAAWKIIHDLIADGVINRIEVGMGPQRPRSTYTIT